MKNYEYLGSGEVYDKKNKKWTLELPSDSHLLLYLFCAFLEHPKWMLHVDATSYAGSQSSKNPLFLGVLPPKERFPEKYIAVVSTVPSVLHPGACILVVGKQGPPIFALYWDKKLQFSLQVSNEHIPNVACVVSGYEHIPNTTELSFHTSTNIQPLILLFSCTYSSHFVSEHATHDTCQLCSYQPSQWLFYYIGMLTILGFMSGKNCTLGFHLAFVP